MLGRRRTSDDARVLRKDRTGADPFKVGLIVLVVIGALTYLGFTKDIPFTHGYRVKAVFQSANSIRKNSPVRIAGVNVGKVKSIERQPGTDAAIVEMEIDKKGLPIHKDAEAKIRPRIFLEGNFFVDLKPGTPSSPTLSSGDTLPVTQTATPVQLDQVLTALQADTRKSLQRLLEGLGTGLTRKPTTADDAANDPSTRGQTAAQSLNDAISYGKSAGRDTAIVSQALLGTQAHDLSGLIAGLGKVTTALDRNEGQLQNLVTNFNTTVAATASQSANLRASIRLLGPTLETANRTLTSLNSSFPSTRAFAREILPGVRETPATLKAAFPWIAQTRGLLGPTELKGLSRELSPATGDLAKVIDSSLTLLPQADLLAKCVTNVILPTGDVKIQDGAFSTGAENYKEFWYTMVGLAGEGQNFDGNGQYVRFQPGGGTQTVGLNTADKLFGNAAAKPLGTRPAFPGKRSPYKPEVPCYTQQPPDLQTAATGPADGQQKGFARTAGSSAIARQAARQSASSSAAGGLTAKPGSLTAQLMSRLNPFRTTAPAAGGGGK
jgi:phospholipid/cholesterol/gamma-HCH transport system substrate-binding protein